MLRGMISPSRKPTCSWIEIGERGKPNYLADAAVSAAITCKAFIHNVENDLGELFLLALIGHDLFAHRAVAVVAVDDFATITLDAITQAISSSLNSNWRESPIARSVSSRVIWGGLKPI